MVKQTLSRALDQFKKEISDRFLTHEQIMDNLAIAIVELQVDMKEVKRILKEEMVTKADFQELLNRLDKDAQLYKKFDQEQTVHSYRLRELTNATDQHTKEIKELQHAVFK